MLLPSSTLVLLTLLLEATSSNAARMQMLGRRVGKREALSRRAQVNGKIAGDATFTGLNNAADITYTMKLTIGGVDRNVLVDTGSSDLWTVGQVNAAKDTNLSGKITYAKGDAEGNIFTADVDFAGHKISNQAYINVTSGANADDEGLIGLGPYISSVVRTQMKSSAGDPVLYRLFAQNTSTPNFLSFSLSRKEDPTEPFPSEITVGEYIEGLENVTSTPKNAVQILPTSQQGAQHWSLLIDAIIGPDGNPINFTTTVPKQTKPVAIVDCGFSLPQVPRHVSDSIYGRVQGARWDETAPVGPAWAIPCDQNLTASVVIGGVTYFIHPLDLSLAFTMSDGSTVCYGSFQPSTINFADASSQYDIVLGMAFLRNTYTVINFGDFTDNKATDTEPPFIQLLPMTSPSEAHSDFVSIRMGGIDNTSDLKYALLSPDQAQTSPETSPSDHRINLSNVKTKAESAAQKVKKILIIVGIVVLSLVVLGLLLCALSVCGICACLRGRRSGGGLGLKGREMGQVYQPLHHPAPASHAPQYGVHGNVNYGNIA